MVSDERRQQLLEEYFGARVEEEIASYSNPRPDASQILMRQRLKLALGTLCHQFPEGAKILDLGCGCGLGAATLADLGFEVTAVDLIPALVEHARARSSAPVHWVTAPFSDKLAPKGSFDAVMSLGFLEYQERAGKELVKMRRLLKPGGLLLLSVPNTLSPGFQFGLSRAYYRLVSEPEDVPIRHTFTPERLQRLLGMAGYILLDYQWLPKGEGEQPLALRRDRDLWNHRIKLRMAPEMLTLSRTYTPQDTSYSQAE